MYIDNLKQLKNKVKTSKPKKIERFHDMASLVSNGSLQQDFQQKISTKSHFLTQSAGGIANI